MKLYRITTPQYLKTCWNGLGAELFGGRWNSPGHRVVYCATHISLAILEILVHLEDELALAQYRLLEIDIPHQALLRLEQPPLGWDDEPAGFASQQAGDTWLDSGEGIGLLVPSVVVPMEYNALLNPEHPDFAQYRDRAQEVPLQLDPRLRRGTR